MPPGLLVLAALAVAAGCGGPGEEEAPIDDASLKGVQLRLLVVDDPQLAAAAERLRGEWTAQTGSEFDVLECSETELLDAEKLPGDALIAPSALLAPLAQRDRVAPVPHEILERKSGPWPGIFETLRTREAAWDRTIYGVPFGSPVLTCYYRADLLKELGRRPPQSWGEYEEVAELLASRGKPGSPAGSGGPPWCGTIEPLAEGWAGLTLLARAAPAAKHRDNFAALFDIETMEPLVAGEPFVRALEQLVAASRHGPEEPWRYDPAAARAAFWRGLCGMALSWPTGAKPAGLPPEPPPGCEVGFLELFGSPDVYDVATRRWETRGPDRETRVTLLGIAGRLGMVSGESESRKAAFQLLFWLSGEQLSSRLCAASPATTLFRESHLAQPEPWVEPPVPEAAAAQYAVTVDAALRRDQLIFALRIPGRDQYLDCLDAAVLAALRGESEPAEALGRVAEKWSEITAKLGLEEQKRAYWRSLGLQ